MIRNLKLRTVAEELVLKAHDDLTLEEFLRAKRIPPSLFQGYLIDGEDVRPIPLNTQILNIPPQSEIVLRCIRNTDLRDVLPQKISYSKVNNPITTISDLNIGGGECTETIYEIDTESAKQIVWDKISIFIKAQSQSDTIIVGISGGGDSNTLVESLMNFSSGYSEKKFVFFTIILNPIWPSSAAERAAELCRKHNIQHQIFGTKEIETLFGMKNGLDKCYAEYCQKFGNNTSHFFGTYLISLVARKLCKKYKTDEYILGFNREDLLADLLYSLMNGQKPLEFPVRRFGKIKLLMPLWEVPKVVLDACYPKYSLSNYQEREMDESTFQRNIIYYLAHGVDDVYSNLGLSLMQGVQKIFANSWPEFQHEKDFDLYITEYADKSKIDEMKTFFGEYFFSQEERGYNHQS